MSANKQFVESKTAKASLKWYLLFTFMANAFVAAHYFMKKYKVHNLDLLLLSLLQKMYMITTKATPDPFLWELATIGTFIPSVIGWSACAKVNNRFSLRLLAFVQNNVKRMNMYIWGILIFGLPPLIWGAWEHHEELLKYMNSQGYRRTIAGYPRAIVIYGFILCFGEV